MVYTEEEARRIIVQAGHRLVKKGLTARTWGNISARISDTHFAITPSGRAYETLQPEDIVVVKIEDCSWEGDQKPSSERRDPRGRIPDAARRKLCDSHPPGRRFRLEHSGKTYIRGGSDDKPG